MGSTLTVRGCAVGGPPARRPGRRHCRCSHGAANTVWNRRALIRRRDPRHREECDNVQLRIIPQRHRRSGSPGTRGRMTCHMHLATAAQPGSHQRAPSRNCGSRRDTSPRLRPGKAARGRVVETPGRAPGESRQRVSVLRPTMRAALRSAPSSYIGSTPGKSTPLLRDVLHAHLGGEQFDRQPKHALSFHATRAVDRVAGQPRDREMKRLEESRPTTDSSPPKNFATAGRADTNDFMRFGIQTNCRQRAVSRSAAHSAWLRTASARAAETFPCSRSKMVPRYSAATRSEQHDYDASSRMTKYPEALKSPRTADSRHPVALNEDAAQPVCCRAQPRGAIPAHSGAWLGSHEPIP